VQALSLDPGGLGYARDAASRFGDLAHRGRKAASHEKYSGGQEGYAFDNKPKFVA
jgi:hypothetical protein